jgi:polar amino acid transport system ATP-binding protein
MDADDEAVVRLQGVEKSLGGAPVLRDINLVVAQGEVVSLIGPSGSGKTTLLRCIDLLEVPDRGIVEVAGSAIRLDGRRHRIPYAQLQAHRRIVGMVFQQFNLFPHMTVLGNLVEGPRAVLGLPAAEAEAEAMTMLERMGLAAKAKSYPRALSGGQQQRVAIVRAMLMRPRVMLFDEVTASLDPRLSREVLDMIRALADDGMSMVIVTHEMAFAQGISDRIVYMEAGQIVCEGTPQDMITDPRHPQVREFIGHAGEPV